MKSEITKREETRAELAVLVDEPTLAPHVQAAYDKLRSRVKAAGFRPGKAPNHIVERELGPGVVQSEVLEQAVMRSYAEAIKQHELPVVASPDVNITKFVPYTELEYKASVDLMPPVKLADYKQLKVKREVPKIEEAEIDQVIEDLRRRLATRKTVDRAVQSGDEVNLDFEGQKGGKAVEGAASKSYDLVIGSGSFIPGFEDQLIGLKAGQEKTFDITFPKDYGSSELAGQKVTFKVKLNKVQEVILPDVDQKFLAEISPHQKVEDLKADIRERITAEKDQEADRAYEAAVLEELVDKSSFKAPEALLQQQAGRLEEDLAQRLAAQGLDIDKYLQLRGQTRQQFEQELRPEAEKRVGLALVLTEIAKTEQLKVSEDEVHAELERLQGLYNDRQMQAELARPEAHEEVYNHLLAAKTIAKIIEHNR